MITHVLGYTLVHTLVLCPHVHVFLKLYSTLRVFIGKTPFDLSSVCLTRSAMFTQVRMSRNLALHMVCFSVGRKDAPTPKAQQTLLKRSQRIRDFAVKLYHVHICEHIFCEFVLCTYMCNGNQGNKVGLNLKDRKAGYMEGFRGRKKEGRNYAIILQSSK